jgi:hypothetical protein
MSHQEMWGMIIVGWVAVAGVPYLAVSLASSIRNTKADENRVTRALWLWLPGFLAILLMSQSEIPPGFGLIMSAGYGLILFAALVMWKRKGAFRPTRRVRAFVAASALWIVAVQVWGFIFEWDDSFDPMQFFALNIAPPLVAAMSWFAHNWVKAAGESEG